MLTGLSVRARRTSQHTYSRQLGRLGPLWKNRTASPSYKSCSIGWICLHTSGLFASIREKDYIFYWWLWRIVDYKRGRASAAKEQPHREVGTQSHGPRLREVAGLPSPSRRVRALLGRLPRRLRLFAMRAMRIETRPAALTPMSSRARARARRRTPRGGWPRSRYHATRQPRAGLGPALGRAPGMREASSHPRCLL